MAETNVSPMRSWLHWLQLTRPWNVLAMGIMVTLVLRWQGFPLSNLLHLGQIGWVLVPMFVGAAGNLINDYFDVREDRINKPERALVGRSVKRRVVLVTHWGFTTAALCWSAWLSSEANSLWPLVLVAVFSLVLYLYSPLLKGHGAWGNIAISLCVAGLVVWGGMASHECSTSGTGRSLWIFAGLLGWLNFLREWVKDIQDTNGDQAVHHHTLAMHLTASQNRNGLLIGMFLGGIGMLAWVASMSLSWWRMPPMLIFFFGVVITTIQEKPKSVSAWLKVLMGSMYLLIV